MRNDDLVVHGNGSQKRIFCHIDDAIDGTLELWKSDSGFGEAFNLGGFEEIDILSLAHKIIEICNSSSNIEFISYEDLRKTGFEDMQRRIPDTSKLKRSTGWTPKKNLDDILSDYHEYLREE
jgi:UDP-glucose 4-epimerase